MRIYIYIYIHMCVYVCIYIYIYIYIFVYMTAGGGRPGETVKLRGLEWNSQVHTPGLHNKIPAYNIFARGWVAQEPFFSSVVAKNFQGLGPKRRESSNGDRV